MKKKIKTYEELAKCHLKPFEATHQGCEVKGIVFVDSNKDVFCLQDKFDGSRPVDGIWKKYGYAYAWVQFCHLAFNATKSNNTFKNIIVEVDEWQPKFGELVEVSNGNEKWYQRIFVGEYAGNIHCIHENDVSFFEKDTCESYRVLQWAFIRKIEEPKNIEISLEEAKEIIAKEKGIKAEQVNLNFKIN